MLSVRSERMGMEAQVQDDVMLSLMQCRAALREKARLSGPKREPKVLCCFSTYCMFGMHARCDARTASETAQVAASSASQLQLITWTAIDDQKVMAMHSGQH